MAEKHSESSRSIEQTVTRRWIRSEEPTEGWWPWGLIPLLALALIALVSFFYVAPKRVEADVRDTAKQNLVAANYGWATVDADGQEVHIGGTPSEPVNERQLAAATMGTNCGTWAGNLGCPTQVYIDLDKPVAKPNKPSKAIVETPIEPTGRNHDFVFSGKGDEIVLKGEVPNAATKQAFEAAAKRTHFGKRITNQLTISGEAAMPTHTLAFPRALAVLDKLDSGSAWWKDGKLGVRGFVAQANEQGARDLFAASANSPGLGDINLSLLEVANSCDEDFSKLLSTSTIRFPSGRAVIAPSSRKLLRKLAEVAKRCPGTLQIDGHTDNVGKPDPNKVLSQRRADAVVTALGQLGVDTKRLQGSGYGQERPAEPNDTAAGRAKNRRIEIRIAR